MRGGERAGWSVTFVDLDGVVTVVLAFDLETLCPVS